jgi:predicted ATP-dependent serine protease
MEALNFDDLEGLGENDVLDRELSMKQQQLRSLSAKIVYPPSFQAAAGLGAIGKHFGGATLGVVGALTGYMLNKGKTLSDIDKKVIGNKIVQLRREIASLEKRKQTGNASVEGIMSSSDLRDYEYSKYDFTGKWRKFLGQPSTNFAMMVYGLPKSGKSTFCMQFAKYLSNNYGKVLYIAAEEGYSVTLQNKLKSFGAQNDNVYFSNYREYEPIRQLLQNNEFDFVFVDSVNYIKITPQQVEDLKHESPNTAFVTIQQATKDGKHKGEQDFAHNCDTIVEVRDGVATQRGRFQEESYLEVFPPREEGGVVGYDESESDDEEEGEGEGGDVFDYGD